MRHRTLGVYPPASASCSFSLRFGAQALSLSFRLPRSDHGCLLRLWVVVVDLKERRRHHIIKKEFCQGFLVEIWLFLLVTMRYYLGQSSVARADVMIEPGFEGIGFKVLKGYFLEKREQEFVSLGECATEEKMDKTKKIVV